MHNRLLTPQTAADPLRVGYILKQYPRLSETFVLNEILGLEGLGIDVTICSLRPATEGRFHPGVSAVRGSVHYLAMSEKASALHAIRALPKLHMERLHEVIAFIDQLPADRQAKTLLNAIEVAEIVRAKGLNHLHAHFLTVSAHTAYIVHLLTGVSFTITAHAKDIYRYTVDWSLASQIASAAAAIVTVCDANVAHLELQLNGPSTSLAPANIAPANIAPANIIPANIIKVYNGLGPQPAAVGRDERESDLVLGVGRLVEKKGFDLLLDAMATLAARGSDARLAIVGDGDQRVALEQRAADLGISDRVEFLGAMGQDAVQMWMRRARVLAAPCRVGADGNQDALPTVLLEALGAGLPAVATAVAGIPEIISDSVEGLLVDDDVPTIADGIERLLTDDALWDELSTNGPDKLASTFDRDQTIRQLEATFRRAAFTTTVQAEQDPSAHTAAAV